MSYRQIMYYAFLVHAFLVCYGLAIERAIADVEGDATIRNLSSVIVSRPND